MDSHFSQDNEVPCATLVTEKTPKSLGLPATKQMTPSSPCSSSNRLAISESTTNGYFTPQRSLRNSLFISAEAAGASMRGGALPSSLATPLPHADLLCEAKTSTSSTGIPIEHSGVDSAAIRPRNLKQAKIMTKAEKLQLKGHVVDLDSTSTNEMSIGLKPSSGMSFSLPTAKRRKLGHVEDCPGSTLFGSRLKHGVSSPKIVPAESDTIDETYSESVLAPNNRPIDFHDDIQGLIDQHNCKKSRSRLEEAGSSGDKESADAVEAEDLVLSEQGKLPLVRVPGVMNAKLFDYQREGVRFLYNLYVANRGGILADDMGLGKTVQTICFVMAIKAAQPATPTFFPPSHSDLSEISAPDASLYTSIAPFPILIVSPASLLQHWHREFYHWTKLRTYIAHGKHDKVKALADAKENRLDVVLISYETLSSSIKLLNEATFSCVVFDEAHRVKNLKTKLYTACSALKIRRKYGLTGTVMQNSFEELWTLCHVLGFATTAIGDLEYFKRHYIAPIKEGHVQDASNAQISRASIVASSLVEKLSKFILRRTKQCISHQLPPKEDHIVFCAPTELQLNIYKRITDSPLYRLLRQNSMPCACGSGLASVRCCSKRPKALETPSLFDMPKVALPALTRLQQLANHVSLIVPLDLVQELQKLNQEKRRTSAPNFPSTSVQSIPAIPGQTNGDETISPLGTNDTSTSTSGPFGIDQGTKSQLITNFFVKSEEPLQQPATTSAVENASHKTLRPTFPLTSFDTHLEPSTSGRTLSSLITSPFLKMAFGEELDRIVECLANGDDLELCGKLKVLASLLPHWRSQDAKVLLFSSSTRLMDTLARFCTKQGFSFGRLEGTTPIHQRQRLVDQFNKTKSQFIFIVSTKACGVGLNLSSANVVVIFEPHFNVSLDMQASDRAHRIGQVRITRVYRLVSAFTIEELTYRRQIYKQQMANIATEGRHEKRFFKMSEVFGSHLLFSLLDRSQLNTVDILERENSFGMQKEKCDNAEAEVERDSELGPNARHPIGLSAALNSTETTETTSIPISPPDNFIFGASEFRVTRDHTLDAVSEKPSDPHSRNALFDLIFAKPQETSDDLFDGLATAQRPSHDSFEAASDGDARTHLETSSEHPDVSNGAMEVSELEGMDDILKKAGALHSHLNSELFSKDAVKNAQQHNPPYLAEETALSTSSNRTSATSRIPSILPLESLLNFGTFRSTSLSDDMEHLSPAFVGDAACRRTSAEDEFPELM